ncbi:MAG: hypothetical protein IT562_10815 [Alphaproteobacteria bacterium]|nr:hypothetical protein [Alphaproteobacteria bacterium]
MGDVIILPVVRRESDGLRLQELDRVIRTTASARARPGRRSLLDVDGPRLPPAPQLPSDTEPT